jgi:hypothetical protein
MGAPVSGESPKGDKPPSPQDENLTLGPPKPPSPKGAQSPAGVEDAPTSPTHAASSHDATSTSPRPEPSKFPEASLPSPRSYGLGAPGGL